MTGRLCRGTEDVDADLQVKRRENKNNLVQFDLEALKDIVHTYINSRLSPNGVSRDREYESWKSSKTLYSHLMGVLFHIRLSW